MSIKEKWNKLEVRRQLKTASFERTMLSNKLISSISSPLPENLFRDPYMFEFLDSPDVNLEVGKRFTYMGNQYRLQVGNKNYYTNLLFTIAIYNAWYYWIENSGF